MGGLKPLRFGVSATFSDLDSFRDFVEQAGRSHGFERVIVVGGGNDIAWLHGWLPASAMPHVAAEIEYPLLPSWFSEAELQTLGRALESVLAA